MAMSKSTNTNQLLINPTILSKAIEMNKRGMRKQYPTLFLFKKIKDDATIRELTNFGVGSGDTNVVVYGDSYAFAALYYIAQAFSSSRVHQILLLSAPGCLPIYDTESYRKFPKCWRFAKEAVKKISEFKPDVVFLNFNFHYPLNLSVNSISEDIVFHKLQKTVDDIMKYTKRIVLTYPHPTLSVPVNSNIIYNRLVRRLRLTDLNIPVNVFLKESTNCYRRVNALVCKKCDYIYSYRWFCYDKICYAYNPKTFVAYYSDIMHLGLYGIEFLIPYYRNIINELYAKGYI
ncbi:unnamed protein product [Dracunculus medinensis]|uniref:SGNH domain-containing protein n=1 Tax=Dracunculus medinensis TaxID=318479 RepID=A0A0N4URC5_DRAME|nr:unnamed protein product [Dracunculus medinensis]